MKSYCIFCGKPTSTRHHLIFGNGYRFLSDQDGLIIYLCDHCHNMAEKPVDRVHGNSVAEKMSKMMGQMMFIIKMMEKGYDKKDAETEFFKRYGRSWL